LKSRVHSNGYRILETALDSPFHQRRPFLAAVEPGFQPGGIRVRFCCPPASAKAPLQVRAVGSRPLRQTWMPAAAGRWGSALFLETGGTVELIFPVSKAVLKPPHSKRFANAERQRAARSVWSACVFSAAFPSDRTRSIWATRPRVAPVGTSCR
jgi:hypothetical protein